MGQSVAQDLFLADTDATAALGAAMARALHGAAVIALSGDLGSGKTTLARGFLRELGVGGTIRSPTYTLLEPYQCGDRQVFHLDLYRVADAAELEYLGLRDLLVPDAIWLVEWPERGAAWLPRADLTVALRLEGNGRMAALQAGSTTGRGLIREVVGNA